MVEEVIETGGMQVVEEVMVEEVMQVAFPSGDHHRRGGHSSGCAV